MRKKEIIRVFIVDDSNVMIDGFVKIFQDSVEISFAGRANNGDECLRKIRHKPVDIILMDIDMPESRLNGIETAEEIMQTMEHPPKIIFLTVHSHRKFVQSAFDMNASFIGKIVSAEELIQDIKKIHQGGIVIKVPQQPSVEGYNEDREKKRNTILKKLTERQLKIICLVAKGYSSKKIADELGIAEFTVKTHRRNILARLQEFDIGNAAALGAFVKEHNLCE